VSAALVLVGPGMATAEGLADVPRPVGVAQQGAREAHRVRLAGGEDVLGLHRSVMSPTAITGMPTSRRMAAAKGTW